MADEIEISLDPLGTRVLKKLERKLDPKELLQELMFVFDKLGQRAASYTIKTQLSGVALFRRTGNLARSITGGAVLRNGVPAVRVGVFRGPALAYAGQQEHGTQDLNPESPYPVIKPKRAKALAWPQEPVLTPAGVARISSPRQYKARFGYELKFVPFHRGIAVGALYDERELKKATVYEQGRDKKGRFRRKILRLNLENAKAAYILLRQVSLEPAHFLRDGMLGYIPFIAKELTQFLRDLFDERKD